jgi:hypothetical protein
MIVAQMGLARVTPTWVLLRANVDPAGDGQDGQEMGKMGLAENGIPGVPRACHSGVSTVKTLLPHLTGTFLA